MFPRPHLAFTDILGRNHTCGTYGLDDIPGSISCEGMPAAAPEFGFLDIGDLVPGVQNFAAILHGFGEYVADPATGAPLDVPETRPNQPYDVLCENCAGAPYVPIAEFYVANSDGQTVTREITAGRYGTLTGPDAYVATIDPVANPDDPLKQEVICIATNEEFELPDSPGAGFNCADGAPPGGPPPGDPFGATAFATFEDLVVLPGAGTNGGDVIEFNIAITNTSPDPEIYLTAFNYQTKRRGLADITILDGTTQLRRDVRTDATLPLCTSLDDEACFNTLLGIGHFPNVIGNGLLFGQMVWPSADAGRTGQVVDGEQVFVDPVNGIAPTDFWLESVKKNGPFTPLLRGNSNFICVKSGLFSIDPDADAGCAGQPADGDPVGFDADGEPVWTTASNPQRLGLPPGATQVVRIRMEFGDFRGTVLRIAPGTLTDPSGPDLGLQRIFDCSDQRELEYCHPDLIGQNIGYLPNTTATWLTPPTFEEIEYVILNQQGDAPTVMNFADNFGFILAMAGFRPSAEFYRPDPNPALIGTPFEGALMREQVLGAYVDEPDDQCPGPPRLGAAVAVNNAVTSPPVANQLTVTTPIPGVANSGWGCTVQDIIDQAAAPDPCTPLLLQQGVAVALRALQQSGDVTPQDAGTIRTAAFNAQCR